MTNHTRRRTGYQIWQNMLSALRRASAWLTMHLSAAKTLNMSRAVTDSMLRLCERSRRNFRPSSVRRTDTDSLILPQGVIANRYWPASFYRKWCQAIRFIESRVATMTWSNLLDTHMDLMASDTDVRLPTIYLGAQDSATIWAEDKNGVQRQVWPMDENYGCPQCADEGPHTHHCEPYYPKGRNDG